MYLSVSSCFVNQIDGLVREKSFVNVSLAHPYRIFQHTFTISHTMELLVLLSEPFKYLYGLIDTWFLYLNILKSSDQTLALLKMLFILLKGRCADKADLPFRKVWLQDICSIKASFPCGTCSQKVMYFIYIDDRIFFFFDS